MIEASLNPYPTYRDSGVDGLGDVPVHWEVRRLGRLGRLFKGNGGTKADETDEQAFADGIGVSKDGAVQNSRGTDGGIATEATS